MAMKLLWISCFLVFMCSKVKTKCTEDLYRAYLPAASPHKTNVLLVGLFPMFNGENINSFSIASTEAFIYYVKKLNFMLNQKSTMLNMGAVAYDMSCTETSATSHLLDILLNKKFHHFTKFKILAVITSASIKQELDPIKNFMEPYSVPVLVYSKSSMEKDFEVGSPANDHVSFLQPTKDAIRITLIETFFRNEKLRYITIIIEKSDYGKASLVYLEKAFKELNICIAATYDLPTTNKTLKTLAKDMKFEKRSGTVLIWSSRKSEIVTLLSSVHDLGVRNKIWLISTHIDLYSLPSEVLKANTVLILILKLSTTSITDTFLQTYLNMSYKENPWLKYYINNVTHEYKEIINNSLKVKSIKELTPENSVDMMEKSFSITIEAMSTYLQDIGTFLGFLPGRTLPDTLYANLITPIEAEYKKGRIKLKQIIAKNKTQNLTTFKLQNSSFNQVCHEVCLPGYETFFFNQAIKCCWICRKCNIGYHKNETALAPCQRCPVDTGSNLNRTECVAYKKKYRKPSTTDADKIYALSIIGTIVCIFTIAVFIKFRKTPIVRSSDTNKSLIQLTSHMLIFIVILMFTFQPTQFVCMFQPFVIGFLMTITSSVTYIKTRNLLNIFEAKVRLSHSDVILTKVIGISILFILAFLQVIVSVISMSLIPHKHNVERDEIKVLESLRCNNQIYFTFQFVYIKFVALICLLQAFKARKLPENFNETKFIGIAVLVSEVFLLAYIIQNEEGVLTNAVLIFCSNFFLTVIMYGFRVWVMLFQPDKNQPRVFQQQVLESVFEKTYSEHRSRTSSSFV
ncbi:metabotropic glutamate receptor 1-like [Hydractinia symbiolongicarpus]|uniref:metabotropic glutamate receptor 1-like n=1 Tax=Hydractinia symbiolongicarpus TaxID=13093 RepID=UPI002550F43A|nr:metabotropic glutamate receptor 1-like [Hydractinia symbiolongicarpus]